MNITKLIDNPTCLNRLCLNILCRFQGAELPPLKNIGRNVRFPHGLKGIVIHPSTIIEDDVTIFHQVTCGRGDMYGVDKKIASTEFRGIELKRGCVLSAGCKVICNRGTLVVGANTVIGANAVLLNSTGTDEIWGGVPAKLLKYRSL